MAYKGRSKWLDYVPERVIDVIEKSGDDPISHIESQRIRLKGGKYDGQIHTTASDGERSPEELALEVYKGKYKVIVTDHYTIYGAILAINELEKLKRVLGPKDEANIIAGIEVSVRFDHTGITEMTKMHMLGVAVDTENPQLRKFVEDYSSGREKDIDKALYIKGQLEKEDFCFSPDLFKSLSIKRNIYQVLAKDIWDHPENDNRVEDYLGISMYEMKNHNGKMRRKTGHDIQHDIVKWLRNTYGDFSVNKPDIVEFIDVIHAAGGLVILAHPHMREKLGKEEWPTLLLKLKKLGVDGVEAYHPSHPLREADEIAEASRTDGLLVTAGSDSHRKNQKFGTFTILK
ncbi:MAG: hypothetical protein V1744_06360 [Candidatus Altiarchaeota archaeon]